MRIPLDLRSSDVSANYTPTADDRARLALRDGCFKLSGDGVFYTMQGEGMSVGLPATFVRLHFCNLACSWCDSWYTWRKDRKEYYTEPYDLPIGDLKAVILQEQRTHGVHPFVPRVVFTGGEPMIQSDQIEQFMHSNAEFIIEIETNGTIMPSSFLLENVQWNCSPKTSCSGNRPDAAKKEDVLRALAHAHSCFKFVCQTTEDIEEVLHEYAFLPREKIMIMPQAVTREEHHAVYQHIYPTLLHYGLATSPRLQTILFDAAHRRV